MAGRIVQLVPSQKKSKRAGSKSGFFALLDGYLFAYGDFKSTVSFGIRHYWKCKNCMARLTTTEDDAVVSVGIHSCEKSIKEVGFSELFKFFSLILGQRRTYQSSSSRRSNDASELVTLPSNSNLGQIVRRAKKNAAKELPIPRRLEYFTVPDELKNYENGLFLQRYHLFPGF